MTVQAEVAFVDHIECLPPLPTIVHHLLSVTQSPDSSAQHVARALSRDPGVAAKVLRVANSPFYGASREITQVSRAVVMLGARGVRSLVLGICAREAMMTVAQQTPEHARLWHHAIASAAAGELLARQIGFQPAEEAFVAGLLHDVGQLAMATFNPDALGAVMLEYAPQARRLELERERFGMDHAQAGYQILSRWGLPEPLCRAARCHHDSDVQWRPDADRLVAITVLANAMAHIAGFGLDTPAIEARHLEAAARLLKLSESDQMRVFATLERRVAEVAEALASRGSDEPASAAPAQQSSAVWVSAAPDRASSIGQSLLERGGYQVRRASFDDCSACLTPDELIVIEEDDSDPHRCDKLVAELVARNCRKIVRTREPEPGQPLREHDPTTGVCSIPRVFTVLDLKWVEERLAR
jgi:putative nucleotidyltransferase with HDIG domain